MSCLHLITCRRLPDDFTAISQKEDEAVLLAEGVYLIETDTSWKQQFSKCYLLQDDLTMRGLNSKSDDFNGIGYEDLVNLVQKHEKSITW